MTTPNASPSTIFVLSDMRSGSTLVDQLLGAHPGIMSVGELHWLDAYVLQDRSIYNPVHELICTCGQGVGDCSFWAQVAVALGRPLESLCLRPSFVEWNRSSSPWSRLRRVPTQWVDRLPALFRHSIVQRLFQGPRLAQDSIDLFNAVHEVSGRQFVIDSSKSPFRFRAVYDAQPTRTCALILARDYRAVVYSKMKRGHSLEAAAIGWRKKMTQIEALTGDLPPGRKYRLKYEDLCDNPAQELTRICAFLGLAFSPVMLARPTDDIHHIGGSPSKFDPSRTAISMDTAYQQAFDPRALATLRDLVGNVAERWGY